MKKISIIALLASVLATSSAFAKTEGNYIGIDIVRSKSEVKSNSNLASDQDNFSQYYNQKKKQGFYGLGINYKYAFNFNDFFVAPGISYNYLNNKNDAGYAGDTEADPYSQVMKIKSQLTFQTNFGYDVGDGLAVYIPAGLSSFNYTLRTSDSNGGSPTTNSQKSGRESAFFSGFGVAIETSQNWIVNLEYNKFQTFKVTSAAATVNGGQISAKTSMSTVKIGLAYKF